jgi:DNA-directed RNA polymerase specialized sigma24 family protein
MHVWFASDQFAIQMKKEWVLTQDAFDSLLDWLDPEREQAGIKYEAIRTRLIKIFTCRGCLEAELLADETINRVASKVEEISKGYVGDPAHYFYAVAQKVHLEYIRKAHAQHSAVPVETAGNMLSTPPVSLVEDFEPEYRCLERCLERLPKENRYLVELYYQQEKQAKIDHRKLLAIELGIAVNALRIRAHRIRLALRQCVRTCLEQEPAH